MQRARKTFKAILVVLHVGIVIAVSSWAFAQGGGISGSVKDLSKQSGYSRGNHHGKRCKYRYVGRNRDY